MDDMFRYNLLGGVVNMSYYMSFSPVRGWVYIWAFVPRVFLGRINVHPFNGGLLNLYFLGDRGSTNDFDFSLPEKYIFPRFPLLGNRKTLEARRYLPSDNMLLSPLLGHSLSRLPRSPLQI